MILNFFWLSLERKCQFQSLNLSTSPNCISLCDGDMAEYVGGDGHHHTAARWTGGTEVQALNAIIQLHFEKTLEKKRAVDLQKKELWKLFSFFFIFLAAVFLAAATSPPSRLQCHHCWIPIGLLSLAHLIFHVSVSQTLRCINAFKYQRRCHKLTLGLATDRLRRFQMRHSRPTPASGEDRAVDVEIQYQEPPESYLGKFKRNWALHFGFLLLIYVFMVTSSVALLCF